MALSSFLMLCLGALVILHWWLIPRADRRARVDRTAASLPVFVTLAGLYMARTVLLLAVVAGGLVYSALFIASLGGGVTASALGAAIQRVQRAQQLLSIFSPGLSAVLAGLAAIALFTISRRQARVKAVSAFRTMFEEEFAKAAKSLEDGTAEALPPDEAMQAVEAAMGETASALETANNAGDTNLIGELQTQLAQLAEQRVVFDVRRRMTLRFDIDQVLLPPPKNWRERLQLMLVSQGLLSSMRGTARVVSYASLLLLVPSLVSLQTEAAASFADSRVNTLEQLRVEASVREAEEAWQQAQNEPAKAADDDSGNDDEALDILSSEFENALSRMPAMSIAASGRVSLRANAVREAILRVRAEHAPASIETAPRARDASGLTPIQQTTLDGFDQGLGQRGPRTEIGQRMRQQLEQIRQERPAVWKRMKTAAHSAGHSFQQAASIDDYGRFLTDRLVGIALDGAPGQGPLTQAARDLDVTIGHDALNRLYRAKSAEFMSHLARGGTVADAASAVSSGTGQEFWTSGESQRFSSHVREQAVVPESLESRPPTLLPKEEPHVNSRVAETLVSDMNRERAVGTDALASFDDWFPSQADRALATPRARVTAALENAARVRVPSSAIGEVAESAGEIAARLAAEGAQNFLRARSFSMLRGFSRIGGVLIGNEPTSGAALDFRGLSWQQTPGGLLLTVTRSDGKATTLGPYRPSLVHHALAYAADGRPVAVTMVTAAPLAELKILLHPALLDSALGCRAIELDRFVDRFTGESASRRAAELAVRHQQALYGHAWAVQFQIGYALLDAEDKKILAGVAEQASELLADDEESVSAARALDDLAWLASADRSPVVAKPQFYDAALVTAMRSCAVKPGTGLEIFDACIQNRFARDSQRFGDAHTRWYAPPPESIVWSGVRERKYQLDPELGFLKGNAVADALEPLDFMLQVSFTSPPAFLPAGREAASYNDEDPWEFPQIQQTISQSVAASVMKTAADRDILDAMRQFTVLQRFFRVALAEKMGPRFPIERLTELASATAVGTVPSRTPRWNVRQGMLELTLAQRLTAVTARLVETPATTRNDKAATARLRATIDRCVTTIRGSLTRDTPIADTVWDTACPSTLSSTAATVPDSSDVEQLYEVTARFIKQTTDARRLRQALGVQLDAAQARNACPAL